MTFGIIRESKNAPRASWCSTGAFQMAS